MALVGAHLRVRPKSGQTRRSAPAEVYGWKAKSCRRARKRIGTRFPYFHLRGHLQLHSRFHAAEPILEKQVPLHATSDDL